MRQGSNSRRGRGRGNARSNNKQQGRNHTFDSNGPSGRFRGTAPQLHEKYLSLARDANSSGDRIMAENFYQHADHYYRLAAASNPQPDPNADTGYDDDRFGARGPRNDQNAGQGDDDDNSGDRRPERQQRNGAPAQQGQRGGNGRDGNRDTRRDDAEDGVRNTTPADEQGNAASVNGTSVEANQANGNPQVQHEEGGQEAKPRQRRRRTPRPQADQGQPGDSEQELA